MEPKGSYGRQLQRNSWVLGAEGGSKRAQNVILADSCTKINGLQPLRKGALGDLWKHFGGLWKHWGALTWTPEFIRADS